MKLTVALFGSVLLLVLIDLSYAQNPVDINIDDVLANDRLLSQYIKCALGTKKCTREGKQLKEKLPEALKTGCNKCTEIDRENAKKVINHLRAHKPNEWNQLVAKYDPKQEYKKFF